MGPRAPDSRREEPLAMRTAPEAGTPGRSMALVTASARTGRVRAVAWRDRAGCATPGRVAESRRRHAIAPYLRPGHFRSVGGRTGPRSHSRDPQVSVRARRPPATLTPCPNSVLRAPSEGRLRHLVSWGDSGTSIRIRTFIWCGRKSPRMTDSRPSSPTRQLEVPSGPFSTSGRAPESPPNTFFGYIPVRL